MEFNLRSLWGLAALVMCCASCSDSDPVPAPDGGGDQKVSLIASLENDRQWGDGDEVLINGVKYTVDEGVGSSVATIEVPKAEHYCGAYNIGAAATVTGNVLSAELSAQQRISADMERPMVASAATPVLSFMNLLGTLRMNISGDSGKTLTKIVLAASDNSLAGKYTVDLNYDQTPVIEWGSEASATLTVDLGEGVALGESGAAVDILLPAAAYDGFTVSVYDSEKGMMLNAKLPSVEVPRGEQVDVDLLYDPAQETSEVYLKAGVEKAADGTDHVWKSGASIFVNGEPVLLYSGEDTAEGEFGPCLSAENYYASTSSASIDGVSGTKMKVNIPVKQEYGAPLTALNPAAAASTSNSLDFRYIAGVVTLKVSGPHVLQTVELQGKNNRRLAGNGMINMTASDFALSLNADASKSITVDCGKSGVSAEAGCEFRFVMPAGDYSEGFNLVLTDNAGLVHNVEIEGVTVKRNEIAALKAVEWEGGHAGANDLSAYGVANCYMVHAAGDYAFKTRRIDNTPIQNIVKADWLWASRVNGSQNNELISDITYADGIISFKATENKGNALIAAFDASGKIVWSWHIWMTDMPETFDYENNPVYQSGGKTDGFYVMDRNLGATGTEGVAAYGMLYQWGRKDPFIGGYVNETEVFGQSGELTVCNPAYEQAKWEAAQCNKEIGSVDYAITRPMLLIYCDPNNNQANWLDPSNIEADWKYDYDKSLWQPFAKSNYDPCPPGYQIPRKGVFSKVEVRAQRVPNAGVRYTTDSGKETWFPFQGFRSVHPSDKGLLRNVAGEDGMVNMWCSELSVSERAWVFFVSWPLLDNDSTDDSWGYANSVRCVKAYN